MTNEMKMTKKLMMASVLYVVWAAPVFGDKEVVFSNCSLKVKGVTYIKGSCAGSLGSEGSFQIRNKLYNADIDLPQPQNKPIPH